MLAKDEYLERWTPEYEEIVQREARRIHSDGCSGFLQVEEKPCWEHDIHYRTHRDFFTGAPIEQRDADYYLRWGGCAYSIVGRFSPVAWIRWFVLHVLGLGRASWRTGPARLAEDLRHGHPVPRPGLFGRRRACCPESDPRE